MLRLTTFALIVTLGAMTTPTTIAQAPTVDSSLLASQALNEFAMNIFFQTAQEAEKLNINVALSPWTMWSLLTVIGEGARDRTAREMNAALGLQGVDRLQFRQHYRELVGKLTRTEPGVNLEISTSLFASSDKTLMPTYVDIVRQTYGVEVTPVNFGGNPDAAVRTINDHVAQRTRNRVRDFLGPQDVQYAQIVAVSTLYFKGSWTTPFNRSSTSQQAFNDDNGRFVRNVDMMMEVAPFAYTPLPDALGAAVELPYGNNNQMSMVALLPNSKMSLVTFLDKLRRMQFSAILRLLDNAAVQFEGENVVVLLPKFHVTSEFTMNGMLRQMGMREVFDEQRANLGGMFRDPMYLTRVFQKADIAVDEEGTVAASASGGTVAYKSPPAKFEANRPFAYFIVNRATESVVFMGTVVNPNQIA